MEEKNKHINFNFDDIFKCTPIDERTFNFIVHYLLLKDEKYLKSLVELEDDSIPVIVKLIAAMIIRSLDRGSIMQPNILIERLFGKPFTKDAGLENIPKHITIRLIDEDGKGIEL